MKKLYSILAIIFFGVIANAQITNDEPCNAILLSTNSVCNPLTFSNVSSTASVGIPSPGCGNYGGHDVWFKAIIPGSGSIQITSSNVTIGDGAMATYIGNCNSLIWNSCSDDVVGFMPALNLSGLIAGDTIYIRFFGYGNVIGSFTLCVKYDLPFFTNSCSTYNCPVTSPTLLQPSGLASIGNTGIYGCMGSTPNPIWNIFQALDSANLTIGITASNSTGTPDIDYVCWGPFVSPDSGCAQLAASNIISCNYSTSGINSFSFNPVANQYYVLLSCNYSNIAGSYVTYNITPLSSVACDSSFSNDNCPGNTILVGNTCNPSANFMYGATSSGVPSCTSSITVADVWYNFIATASTIIINTDTTNFDPVFELFANACGGTSFGCLNNFSTGYESDTLFGLTIGNTYWLRIFDFNGLSFSGVLPSLTSFSLCIHSPMLTTELAENSSSELSISPNPFTSQFEIKSLDFTMNELKVFDIIGKEIANYKKEIGSKKSITIDMSEFSKGIYYLEIKTENGMMNRKIVKQ